MEATPDKVAQLEAMAAFALGREAWQSDDGLLIDTETGEVLAWPDGITSNRLEWLQDQHHDAKAQADFWQQRAAMAGLALAHELGDDRAYQGPTWRSRYVGGGAVRRIKAEKVREAHEAGALNREQVDALNEGAVKEYDVAEAEKLAKAGVLPMPTLRLLIETTPRAGHVRTEPIGKRAQRTRKVGVHDE